MRRHGICGCYRSETPLLQGSILRKREDGVQDRLVETMRTTLEKGPSSEIPRQRSFICEGLGQNLTIWHSWDEDGLKAMEEWPRMKRAHQVARISGNE